MATSAEESIMAQASAMAMLTEPGPHEVNVAAGRWLTR
jgi:hypothetical protein